MTTKIRRDVRLLDEKGHLDEIVCRKLETVDQGLRVQQED
jgi:hypothetical protein